MSFDDSGDFNRRPFGGRRRPLSQREIDTTGQRIRNIVGDPARDEFSDNEFAKWSERQVDRTTDINGNIINTHIEPFKPEVTRQDLNLDGSVGDKADNFRRDVLGIKKVMSKAGAFDFDPGSEPTTAVNDRFKTAIRNFQAGNDLKVDGKIFPGGPTVHMLGRTAIGQENGQPSGFDAADFKRNFGRDPNLNLSGNRIFGDSISIASNPATELRHPVPKSDPKPIEPEKPAAKPAAPAIGPSAPTAGAGDKGPPAKKPTKRELLEAIMENGRSTAKAMKIDPELLKGADLKTYSLIMGIFSYRHLDKRGQRAVNIELEKFRKVDTALYQELTTMRADILIQPAWRVWSLNDSELRKSIRQNRNVGNMLSVFSTVPGEASAAIAPALVGAGVKIAVGGIVLTILVEAVAQAMLRHASKMQKELERRRDLK